MTSIPKICLNMIVKDESKIIEVCLQSLSTVIDYYVIGDTGSTDDTLDKIKSFFSSHGIEGEIHRIPFVDFEVSRNQSLDLCRNSAAEFEYILLVDADMELFVEDPAFKTHLSAPAYFIRQTSSISYYNARLIRRDAPARYVGVTHEYLDTGPSPVRLAGLWFHDHACGSSRTNKYERDIQLLTAGLRREPDNHRYIFYLAQSYKDCGEYEQAIAWYQKRIASGGWTEEIWYSLYMLAVCYEHLGHEAQFVERCLEAYEYRPGRAEPLYRLARHYRIGGKNEACMMLCEAARRIPYPATDSLFVEDYVYHTGIKEEMSICGFYSSSEERRQAGYDA
ncbi:MAG: glycosyl transferase, partial [Acidobacteria bacterium]|nr:glycosyl transferase [Acidobacteriota bacterium]